MQKTLPQNRLIGFFNTRDRRDTGHLPVIIMSLLLLFSVYAQGQDLEKVKVNVQLKEVTIPQALLEIQKQSGIKYVYGPDMNVYASRKVSISEKNISVNQATRLVLRNTNLMFTQKSDHLIIEESKEAPVPKTQARVKPGTISGKIIDADSGEPLIGSTIMVKGTTAGSLADVDGKYTLTLDPGTYSLEFRYVGYETKLIQNVIVSDGEITSLDVAMKVASSQLGEVVITAEFSKASVEGLLAKQKNNTSMTDGISAEQMRLTPDNNTAQVLKRVSGVTVQNDRFVTIRGLSDRYNNVMINGASAPSTEPNRRNFSFDIVPSALVDNVVVNKTASPDLPSEFTGGMVNIVTKDVPEENFLEFSIGTGINTASNQSHMIGFKRDKYANLGIIDKQNQWYGEGKVYDPAKYYQYVVGNDRDKINEVGSKIPNRWQRYEYPYSPTQSYQFSGGVVKDIGQGKFGLTSAITYRNEQLKESGTFGHIFNDSNQYVSNRYKYNTAIGGLLNLAYKIGKHRVTWKNLYNSRYGIQHDDQLGRDTRSVQDYINRLSDVILKNELTQTRLEGEHVLTKADINVKWSIDRTRLKRTQPDSRFVYAARFPNTDASDRDSYTSYEFNQLFMNWGGVFASDLVETKNSASLDVSVPIASGNNYKVSVKSGSLFSARSASYNGTALRILYPNAEGQAYVASRVGTGFYEIATQESFSQGLLYYRPSYVGASSTGDSYDGKQQLFASYGMLDALLFKKLRLTGGYRAEDNWTRVESQFFSAETGLPSAGSRTYPERDWLPSVNIILNATDKFSIKTSYSKTLSRPEFVERSPYLYYDFAEQVMVQGQSELQRSQIANYDLRFEYYFSPGEIISASVFYKDFDNPVERFFFIGENVNLVEYWNLLKAEARGIELNVMKNLSFINSHSWLKDVYVSGNYTVLRGKITQNVDGNVQSSDRPVQGLSPYIINGGISYQHEKFGVTLSYNKTGRRIVNVGQDPAQVQFENPRDVVDFQLNFHMMKRKLHAQLNISDLLNQPVIIYANTTRSGNGFNADPKGEAFNRKYDYITYDVNKGVNYSLILTYKF